MKLSFCRRARNCDEMVAIGDGMAQLLAKLRDQRKALREEVQELAIELADERTLHQQTLAELEQLRSAAEQVLRDHEPEVHRCDGGDFAIGHADCPIKSALADKVRRAQ